MKVEIPGQGELEIKTVVLDLNGTIVVRGQLVEGVKERVDTIKQKGLRVVLFSGDTRGNAEMLAGELDIEFIRAGTAEEKGAEISKLDSETCAAIGNGLIDVAKLAIVTLQAEGIHTKALLAADVVVPSINDALDLLIDENSLIATLRS